MCPIWSTRAVHLSRCEYKISFFLSLLTFPDVYCVGFVLLAPAPNDDVMLKAFFQGKAKRYVSHLKAHPYVNHIRDKAHFTVDKFIISTIYPFSYYYLMCIPWIMTLEVFFLRFLFFIWRGFTEKYMRNLINLISFLLFFPSMLSSNIHVQHFVSFWKLLQSSLHGQGDIFHYSKSDREQGKNAIDRQSIPHPRLSCVKVTGWKNGTFIIWPKIEQWKR